MRCISRRVWHRRDKHIIEQIARDSAYTKTHIQRANTFWTKWLKNEKSKLPSQSMRTLKMVKVYQSKREMHNGSRSVIFRKRKQRESERDC